MPAFILPDFVMGGLLAERAAMARPLELASGVLPMASASDALRAVSDEPSPGSDLAADVAITIAMSCVALTAGSLTLPRRTA
jgi:hypothetical protein